MKNLLKILFSFMLIASITGCKKDEDNSNIPSGLQGGSTVNVSLRGYVFDENGVLAGVTVSAGGKTTVSRSDGFFIIENAALDKERAVVSATKSGYWLQQKALKPSNGNYLELYLFKDDKSYSVSGTAGGTVSLSAGSTIIFPANAFVSSTGSPYTGTVKITAHEIQTGFSDFGRIIPGGDLMAIDSANESTLLLSYGMVGAKLYDQAGNELMLAPGKSAQIKMPINPAQLGTATPTIPMWHFDEAQGIWKEEGIATKTGNEYVGTVSHFSWWNCDIPCQNANLSIHLTGCAGTPLQFERITITWNGQTRIGFTDSQGFCSGIIPANASLTINCYNYLTGLLDTSFVMNPVTPGTNNTLNLTMNNVGCDMLTINLVNCSGTPVNGSVAVYLNGGISYVGATQGNSVTVTNVQFGNYTIHAVSGSFTGDASININTSSQLPDTIDVMLCDSVGTAVNDLMNVIITDSTHIRNLYFNIMYARYIKLQNGDSAIVLTYTDSSAFDSTSITLAIPGYQPRQYVWDSDSYITGSVIFSSSPWWASITSGIGTTVLTVTPPVGSRIKGNFSGLMNINNHPEFVVATFSGMRIQ